MDLFGLVSPFFFSFYIQIRVLSSDGSSTFVTTGQELFARFWHLANDIRFNVETTTTTTATTTTVYIICLSVVTRYPKSLVRLNTRITCVDEYPRGCETLLDIHVLCIVVHSVSLFSGRWGPHVSKTKTPVPAKRQSIHRFDEHVRTYVCVCVCVCAIPCPNITRVR